MKIAKSRKQLKKQIGKWKKKGKKTAFIPTMGALHAGHLSLIDIARKKADKIIVSIYVNEKQFGEGEDFAIYPRDEKQDLDKLKAAGCDLVFMPKKLYNKNHATKIIPQGAALGLESDFRPDFFAGVALIVTKLFNIIKPDIAVFGKKDYQQYLTIKQIVRDLDMDIKIIGAPIMRENTGLAMSSRNRYFDDNTRNTAEKLNHIMFEAAKKIALGGDIKSITDNAINKLVKAGFTQIDYFAIADSNSLEIINSHISKDKLNSCRLLVAAHCPASNGSSVRLIDNCALVDND